MKPSVGIELETDTDDFPVGAQIDNAGPGPAVIRSVTYYVDRKMIGDVVKLVDFSNLDEVPTFDFDDGDTLAVGEHHWLLSIRSKPHGKDEEKSFDEFIDLIDHHLAIEVKFCPVLPGDCYTKCSPKGWC
jgi:hypothetical protein